MIISKPSEHVFSFQSLGTKHISAKDDSVCQSGSSEESHSLAATLCPGTITSPVFEIPCEKRLRIGTGEE